MSKNTNNSFPILIMTRNEGEYLQRCVTSIIETVSLNVLIYIVDNSSDDLEHINILSMLEKKHSNNVVVIRNSNNLWVLGINKTLQLIRKIHSSPYYFITDGDIDFKLCKAKPCWLSYLIGKMDENIVIGKLGYSLDWSYIESESEMSEILKQERSLYNEKRKIGELYISQVDTTATIFRWDWSIESNGNIYPDHMRYLRPELYSCRTDKSLVVEHLGWYKYKINTLSIKNIDSKIRCFTIVGASLKSEIIRQGSLSAKLFFRIFSRPFQIYWILRRYYFLFKYIWTKGRKLFDGQK
ncbi:glycosyltransferase family 2 protein [Hafnia alvei]|uniref:glycosyltransferase family 2 protein n=1 Tax=Hafnia alvei TaxID=569 RepID=UPI000E028274|nr:glycosyltransferase family A protein [Hafnia alvei]STQ68671.1 Glycosyl transferase family 2 [Hafnia alvei]